MSSGNMTREYPTESVYTEETDDSNDWTTSKERKRKKSGD